LIARGTLLFDAARVGAHVSAKPEEGRSSAETRAAMPSLIAITGATGFIGQHLLRELPRRGHRLRVLLRRPAPVPKEASSAVIGDLAQPRNMAAALEGVEAVIHSAGIAQGMTGVPADDYRVLNTDATLDLARAAGRAGAKRFVFLSSIRAQTGPTAPAPLTEDMSPRPTDAYGRSKLDAELGLAELDLDWVALRPVLVYGPGAKGNMAQLLALARSPYPLPLAGFTARRSLVSLESLTGAIEAVLAAPGRLRRPLIVAEPEPLTVGEMVAALRRGLGRRPNLFPLPASVLAAAFRASGRQEAYERLAGSLVAHSSALAALGWAPAATAAAGLERLARAG
jgi:UDP-glucose 4-epimerase